MLLAANVWRSRKARERRTELGGRAKLPNSGPLRFDTDNVRWPLDESGGDVLREASGTGEPGSARGEFRWEPVDRSCAGPEFVPQPIPIQGGIPTVR